MNGDGAQIFGILKSHESELSIFWLLMELGLLYGWYVFYIHRCGRVRGFGHHKDQPKG